ncbi:MAG: MFS transporter [Gammaproteobacteria bacterium]|nr:MFS transporter [Gammaproteobacteria bacterium]
MQQRQLAWAEALGIYLKPRVLVMFLFGFSAGLPYLLVFSTLTAWLRDYGVSRTAIGFFAWVGITYSIKVLWAPVIDTLGLPMLTRWLGKRRSWMLLAQLGIGLGLLGLAHTNPQLALLQVALLSLWIAFCSATQDVVIDAYRIEAVVAEYQGAMAANYIAGYRVALLVAGAGALYLAEWGGWFVAYGVMAALMVVGIVATFIIVEPKHDQAKRQVAGFQHHWVDRVLGSGDHSRLWEWFVRAVCCPFLEFFQRNGRFGLVLLLFVGVFRLSDITMGIMAYPFYLDLGFSKTDIAQISKIYGFFCTVAGAYLGGLIVLRYGILRPLIVGALMAASTNLLFAYLAGLGPSKAWLTVTISADNISGGFANAIFIAYISSLTNQAYTATQYALFNSLMTLPGKFISGFSGLVVDAQGYAPYFVYVALLGIPAILLAVYLWRRDSRLAISQPNSA